MWPRRSPSRVILPVALALSALVAIIKRQETFEPANRRLSFGQNIVHNLNEFSDPKTSYVRSDSSGEQLELAASTSLQSEFETSQSSLLQSQEIWYSRYKNPDIYSELNEKQQNEQLLRAELLDKHRAEMLGKEQELEFQLGLSVCGRQTNVGTTHDLALLENFKEVENTCPGANSNKLLLIQGDLAQGRTGNNLIEFLHALQMARDKDYNLAIGANSWVFEMLNQMWFNSGSDHDWAAKFEKEFCVKIIQPGENLKGWSIYPHNVNSRNSVKVTKILFDYQSELPLDEYVASQSQFIQKLFRHYNFGPQHSMCSDINAIFGDESANVMYSAIHNRHLEGAPGIRLMQRMRRGSGCHPTAALNMQPEYVKSILRPLGMLNHPIVLITDGQDPSVAQRLSEDPEIGPMLRVVPETASWIGGDLTLAIMSNVFIGNPASSFSGFIAKSRIAMGFGQNHLFRAEVSTDGGPPEWVTTCGDACIFDKHVIGNMS